MMDKLRQDNITLDEASHTYTIHTAEHLRFSSATTFIKSFFAPFEKEKIAQSLIDRYPGKYGDRTVDGIIGDWNAIADRGTEVHLELENWCHHWVSLPEEKRQEWDSYPELTYDRAKHGAEWLKENLEPHYELYPEVRLYSTGLQLAGTVDLLIREPNEDLWVMADWKTNKDIKTKSYGNRKGLHSSTCNLDDCNYIHYALQMSLYQWILDKEYGIDIMYRNLVHLREKQTRMYPLGVKVFQTPYLNYNIEKMVEYRRQRKAEGKLFEDKLFV